MSSATFQLEEHIVCLREELDREREERSYFQLERDKIQAFWEISKRRLEEQKAQLRSRHVEREEAEERHRVEITVGCVYKQKLRHVLSEHHGTISGLKVDAVASTMLVQNQHTQSELGLQRDLHDLQADFREKKFHSENNKNELKLKHQVELMELANNCDKIIRDMEMKYHEKMQSMTEAEVRKRQAEVNGIKPRMKCCVETLIKEHDRAIRDTGDYYSVVQQKLLVLNKLKDELAKEKKLQTRVDKNLSAAEQEKKRLSEALQEAQQKLPEIQKQQHEDKQKETKIMCVRQARVKVHEKELRDLSMEHELLLQAFGKVNYYIARFTVIQLGGDSYYCFRQVQQEHDELLQKETGVIVDMQQKSGLKQLLLEKKLAALTETVEKKEAQLCAALSASNIDQTAGSRAANKLQGMLESKQATIDALQSDLARDCTEYDDLLQTCKEKLKYWKVPLYKFPFRPSEQLLGGQARVQDSPGAAASKQ
ncbi:dynein regulatory complex subunit 4-like [Lycodopsis pacificus]